MNLDYHVQTLFALMYLYEKKENGFHEHFLRNIGKGGTSSDFIAITFSGLNYDF